MTTFTHQLLSRTT